MTLTILADRDPHGTTTPCYVRPFTARIVEFAEANFPVFIRHDSFYFVELRLHSLRMKVNFHPLACTNFASILYVNNYGLFGC